MPTRAEWEEAAREAGFEGDELAVYVDSKMGAVTDPPPPAPSGAQRAAARASRTAPSSGGTAAPAPPPPKVGAPPKVAGVPAEPEVIRRRAGGSPSFPAAVGAGVGVTKNAVTRAAVATADALADAVERDRRAGEASRRQVAEMEARTNARGEAQRADANARRDAAIRDVAAGYAATQPRPTPPPPEPFPVTDDLAKRAAGRALGMPQPAVSAPPAPAPPAPVAPPPPPVEPVATPNSGGGVPSSRAQLVVTLQREAARRGKNASFDNDTDADLLALAQKWGVAP